MYKSPIELITSQMALNVSKSIDNSIYQAVQNVDVLVDKDELIKALSYDRNQYNKGFEDGAKMFAKEIKAEIHEALENNYKVRSERIAKPNIDMADEFVSYCDGKIHCLRGIDDFIDELLRNEA